MDRAYAHSLLGITYDTWEEGKLADLNALVARVGELDRGLAIVVEACVTDLALSGLCYGLGTGYLSGTYTNGAHVSEMAALLGQECMDMEPTR